MPASPSAARAINDREALRLLRSGPLTAADLTRLTGLSRPTVADLVRRLGDAGLVTVVGEADVRRRGPNAQLYGIVRTRAHVAALDVRTHSVSVVVADLLGEVLAEASTPIGPATTTEHAVARTLTLLTDTALEAGAPTLHSVGIGVPGLVDPRTGDLRGIAGLPRWHGEVLAELRARLAGRLLVENETSVAAVAEHRLGATRDLDTFALLWLGHGTGAALVVNGGLHRGASGGAGELGFLPVPGRPWPAGGGFHGLACSAAIAELATEHGLVSSSLVPSSDLPGAAAVRDAVTTGADGFLDALADRVAVGAASIAAVLDPGCVVLGGEIGRAGGEDLAGRVADRLSAASPITTTVRPSALGGEAVLRGALLTACESAQDDVFATV
ncbi:ROK family transcriptional regulator [Actinosynnema sp. NPDC047251]|uniref:Transcriptional regulator, ROK family n=1 Tax=Saccharothrix espanaensis (strain ATCC 51144 / DSM 44229 / JCM 9112 / NBRC 15066 / NRRL 15764) TaxID=1179773 RepID=K0K395_SACES|nr:ROK family transcriptional regulator [Saccharothrix espanaensis]CCH31359.1 Transcriptional regulator, ROK family [Saccharothrix espanaensis DSM 44229]